MCFEVATIIERVRVDDHQGDVPGRDFVVFELGYELAPPEESRGFQALTSTLTHFSCARAWNSRIKMRSDVRSDMVSAFCYEFLSPERMIVDACAGSVLVDRKIR